MKSVCFAVLFLFLNQTFAAYADDSNSTLTESQLFMKASCEALSEFATPISAQQQIADKKSEDKYHVESIMLISAEVNKMMFYVSFALNDDKRSVEQSTAIYNCFECVNRVHEPFVFTTENDPEVACKED